MGKQVKGIKLWMTIAEVNCVGLLNLPGRPFSSWLRQNFRAIYRCEQRGMARRRTTT